MAYLPDYWRLVEGTNKHYAGKTPGVDYEATMQQCFKIETLNGEFVADIIVERGELGYGLAKLAASAPQLADTCRDVLLVLQAIAERLTKAVKET